jgi:hypothetical protein
MPRRYFKTYQEPRNRIRKPMYGSLAGRYDNPISYSVPSLHELFQNSCTSFFTGGATSKDGTSHNQIQQHEQQEWKSLLKFNAYVYLLSERSVLFIPSACLNASRCKLMSDSLPPSKPICQSDKVLSLANSYAEFCR